MTDLDAADAPSPDPLVVMGVSGVGKTTIALLVSERLGMPFIDADDLHGEANVAKMSAGIPLTDEDRMPWLQRVGDALDQHPTPVVACSALKRAYRDVLRSRAPRVRFVMLAADLERLSDQVSHREGHFMPPGLLQSQLDTLEPLQDDERGMVIQVDDKPDVLVDRVIENLG